MKIALNSQVLSIFSWISSTLGAEEVYLVGGYVRDLLLSKESHDLDFATSARPETIQKAFPFATAFVKFGTFSFKKDGYHITVTSFRKECAYTDFRHPRNVEFIDDMSIDYLRRDFTVNALYLSNKEEIIDPSGQGIMDIEKKILRFIKNPYQRVKEDPLRIIRGFRFMENSGFSFEKETSKAMNENLGLLKELNPDKIKEELRKCDENTRNKLIKELQLQWLYEK